MFGSEATTRGVHVAVEPRYDPGRSTPGRGRWFFLYSVTVTNRGEETVQLLDRHWKITDETGQVEEVEGAGVVGEQPVLSPGESFRYTSGCPLPTPAGTMQGSYGMIVLSGKTEAVEEFRAEIAPFVLSEPLPVH